jgi:hypothetical protein
MRVKFIAILLLLTSIATAGIATPLDPALQQELLGVYDRYNKAIAAGKLADAAALRTSQPRTELLAGKTKAEQADMLRMAHMMAPDSISAVHATLGKDGQTARIITMAAKTFPAGLKIPGGPRPGTVGHGELTLNFAIEGRDWKFAGQVFGPDPADIKTCHDEPKETEDSYDHNVRTNEGGVIRSVDFKSDHTLVVIRVVDEDNCIILPPRAWLDQHDAHADKYIAWAVLEADGLPHRSDKQRLWAAHWTVTSE